MAAEEGLVEDSFEVPALLVLVRRAPGPEGRPPGEAKSQKKLSLQDLWKVKSPSISSFPNFAFLDFTAGS